MLAGAMHRTTCFRTLGWTMLFPTLDAAIWLWHLNTGSLLHWSWLNTMVVLKKSPGTLGFHSNLSGKVCSISINTFCSNSEYWNLISKNKISRIGNFVVTNFTSNQRYVQWSYRKKKFHYIACHSLIHLYNQKLSRLIKNSTNLSVEPYFYLLLSSLHTLGTEYRRNILLFFIYIKIPPVITYTVNKWELFHSIFLPLVRSALNLTCHGLKHLQIYAKVLWTYC